MADLSNPPVKPGRLTSLDALRGFDMMWIMGADSIGVVLDRLTHGQTGWVRHLAEQIEHVPWDGFRFYDLIFPLFVFIAGVSLAMSLGRTAAVEGKDAAFVRLLKRSLLLYGLGLFFYGGLSQGWDQVRYVGVLQRIATSYFGAGLCFLLFKPRTCVGICVGLLVGYWALMTFVPVPGFGAGNFEEGKNLANWIDFRFLPGRRWDGDHDPEGLLSSLPAVATCLIGVFAGLWLKDEKIGTMRRLGGLVVAGVAMLLVGWAWSWQFPIIKKLWTSTFVLVAGGWSCLLLALFHWVVDVRGWNRWCVPFLWVGLNPITIYLSGALISYDALSRRVVGGPVLGWLEGVQPHLGELLVAVVGIGWGFLLAWFLYRRRLFLRL